MAASSSDLAAPFRNVSLSGKEHQDDLRVADERNGDSGVYPLADIVVVGFDDRGVHRPGRGLSASHLGPHGRRR